MYIVHCTLYLLTKPSTSHSEADINDNTIISENVISEDPMNWRTWAKFANPLEWFNGISNYQVSFLILWSGLMASLTIRLVC